MLTSEKNINNYVIIVTERNNGDRMLIQNNVRLRETDFKNENELQTFIENNIETIFNLQLVKSQFVIETFRFDTLAYDEETNAFVILEYKNTKNNSLVDQGMSYSSALRRRKEKAILEFNNKFKVHKTEKDFDWSSIRLIFVSPTYTTRQLTVNDFPSMPIETWTIAKYENGVVDVTLIPKNKAREFENLYTFETNEKDDKGFKSYTKNDHFAKTNETCKHLYNELEEKMLQIDNFDIVPKQNYIAFKGYNNILCTEFYTNYINIIINLKHGELNDPEGLAISYLKADNTFKGHHGTGDYYVTIKNYGDVDKVMPLLLQSLDKNKK